MLFHDQDSYASREEYQIFRKTIFALFNENNYINMYINIYLYKYVTITLRNFWHSNPLNFRNRTNPDDNAKYIFNNAFEFFKMNFEHERKAKSS